MTQTKNKMNNMVKKSIKPPKAKEALSTPERRKTSLYLNVVAWEAFTELTKAKRGLASQIIEEFVIEYVKVYGK